MALNVAAGDKMERMASASSSSTGSLGGAASKENRGTPRAAAAAAAARGLFAWPRKSVDLWRDSTAVSTAASELGYTSVRELAGTAFIPNSRLRTLRQLGEGAYAGKPAQTAAAASTAGV